MTLPFNCSKENFIQGLRLILEEAKDKNFRLTFFWTHDESIMVERVEPNPLIHLTTKKDVDPTWPEVLEELGPFNTRFRQRNFRNRIDPEESHFFPTEKNKHIITRVPCFEAQFKLDKDKWIDQVALVLNTLPYPEGEFTHIKVQVQGGEGTYDFKTKYIRE